MFPGNIGGLSLDGVIKREIGTESMEQAVGVQNKRETLIGLIMSPWLASGLKPEVGVSQGEALS